MEEEKNSGRKFFCSLSLEIEAVDEEPVGECKKKDTKSFVLNIFIHSQSGFVSFFIVFCFSSFASVAIIKN